MLTVEDLKTYFHTRAGIVRAVDGISFEVKAGETLGLVGESGSGKSVSGYSLLGLIPTPPGKIESGTALFGGVDLLKCTASELQSIRGKRIGMIFQDPMTCLNPFVTIGQQLMEPLFIHEKISVSNARIAALEALREVGILDGDRRMAQYPHEFSGGMRQRIMIAIALILKPELLIADEPTTALDVTMQAQILDLIRRLQRERGMAVIFVTHDLGIVAGLADEVMVMYAGKIVERARTRELFYAARHPYTRGLLASIPSNHSGGDLYNIPGLPPDLGKPLAGCAFGPRCSNKKDVCGMGQPTIKAVAPLHYSSCVRIQEGSL
ncbi:MAG: ABC transporter ATP-binding protein [Deltaproteobacteria bacterium]|nr:ABC transporter ATP-binding protein [Deltaproteobacteria bacterium]